MRLSLIASMITDRPGVISTMDAAARAASVAPDTAMPQSAFFSAGASFTPSPVMPTMWPRFCRTSTMWNLCSGNTWANPSAFSIDSAAAVRLLALDVAQAGGIEDVGAHPQCLGGLPGDGDLVAGDHLDRDAQLPRGGDGRLGIVARRVEQGQHAEELPGAVPVGAGHAQRPKAAGGEVVDRLVDRGLDLPALADSARITCGAPLVTLNVVPSAAVTVASVRLCTGSNGWKWTTW